VTEREQAVTAITVGAVAGGIAGYLFFTDHGRVVRRQLEPGLDEFARELNSWRGTIAKVMTAAHEGWRVLNDAMSENQFFDARHTHPHQSNPF
jgi:hypothetical protein